MADQPKKRFFNFIVYEDSAPDGWIEKLKQTHCMYAISPKHEPDGEHDKPHWHVIYHSGNGPITLQAAKAAIPADIPANGYVEPALSSSGSQRYLIHLDDPEKQQWAEGINAITVLNGFPLDLSRELSKSEKAHIRNELMKLIRENGICEYSDFIFGLMDMGEPDMLDYACNHTILFEGVIRSIRHSGSRE